MSQHRSIKQANLKGELSGIMSCELGNWVGKVLYFPKQRLFQIKSFPGTKTSGVVLFLNSNTIPISVNAFENIQFSLRSIKQKAPLDTKGVLLFINKTEPLSSSQYNYLRQKLEAIYLDNSHLPFNLFQLKEVDIVVMEEFFELTMDATSALGIILPPPPSKTTCLYLC